MRDIENRKLIPSIQFAVDGRYDHVKRLGAGSFGEVHQFVARSPNSDEVPVAIKRIVNINPKSVHIRRVLRELCFLHHFRGYKHIVNLIDVDLVVERPYQGLYCYQELLETDLSSVIRNTQEVFTECTIMSVGYQVLCALKYIHSVNVIHRDLKPANILLSRTGTVKICDFGLARGLFDETHDSQVYTAYVTTRWYRAPEIILCIDKYHYGLDIWAAGCIVAELVLRKALFRGNNWSEQLVLIFSLLGEPPSDWQEKCKLQRCNLKTLVTKSRASSKVLPRTLIPLEYGPALPDLIESMLVLEPDKRLTAQQACRHQYFQQISVESQELSCTEPVNFDHENVPISALRSILEKEVAFVRGSIRGR